MNNPMNMMEENRKSFKGDGDSNTMLDIDLSMSVVNTRRETFCEEHDAEMTLNVNGPLDSYVEPSSIIP